MGEMKSPSTFSWNSSGTTCRWTYNIKMDLRTRAGLVISQNKPSVKSAMNLMVLRMHAYCLTAY
jgi:hypothetical protein